MSMAVGFGGDAQIQQGNIVLHCCGFVIDHLFNFNVLYSRGGDTTFMTSKSTK